MWLPDDELEELVRALRPETAKRLGEAFPGQDFLDLNDAGASQAQRIVLGVCDDEDRNRVLGRRPSLGADGQKQLAERLCDELFGMGVLQPYTDDRRPDAEETSVNGPRLGFVTSSGNQVERIDPHFASDEELRAYIQRQVSKAGGRIDDASPYASVRLANGCRLTAVLPPITGCPRLTIRTPRARVRSVEDLAALNLFSPPPPRAPAVRRSQSALAGEPELARFLDAAVTARMNILVSGGTGTGKTTSLRGLCGAIPAMERVVTIETDPELMLEGDVLANCVELWSRPANLEGIGEIPLRQLVKVALRLRPSRILIGEVMGPEAADMLSAMNSGHEGSMCTIHADSGARALEKIVLYTMQAEERWSPETVRQLVAEAIDLVVQIRYDEASGHRFVEEVVEVAGMEGDRILTNVLWEHQDGQIVRRPIRPRKADRLARAGWA
jgi:pilus assembly protein CpaF